MEKRELYNLILSDIGKDRPTSEILHEYRNILECQDSEEIVIRMIHKAQRSFVTIETPAKKFKPYQKSISFPVALSVHDKLSKTYTSISGFAQKVFLDSLDKEQQKGAN